eukprot:4592455-Amphidinium_carterae.1
MHCFTVVASGGTSDEGDDSRNLLEHGEMPVNAESYEDFFLRPNLTRPGRHIQLFRKLQAMSVAHHYHSSPSHVRSDQRVSLVDLTPC